MYVIEEDEVFERFEVLSVNFCAQKIRLDG